MRIRMPKMQELRMMTNLADEGRMVASVAIEHENRTIMYGCIRTLAELALFAPPGATDRERVMALKSVFREGRRVLKNIGEAEAILFADSQDRADIFSRHFGARTVDKVTMSIEV